MNTEQAACQYESSFVYHRGEARTRNFGGKPLNYCDYHYEVVKDRLWQGVSTGLAILATSKPSGDDAVFDYWPNALEGLSLMYQAWTEEGSGRIEWYVVQHMEESLPMDVVSQCKRALAYAGWTLVLPEEDAETREMYSHIFPPDQIIEEGR